MPRARPAPTSDVSRRMLQLSSARPYFATGNWKYASGATTRRSQIIDRMTPAPIAGPLIAPITGIGAASMAMFSALALSGSFSAIPAASVRSAPELNTLPAPVRTIARTSSAAACSIASRRPSTSSQFSALRRSSRCISRVITLPSRVTPIMAASLSRRPIASPCEPDRRRCAARCRAGRGVVRQLGQRAPGRSTPTSTIGANWPPPRRRPASTNRC